jgi:PPK2 family polyphosphate:nucleotide phosphotransferase
MERYRVKQGTQVDLSQWDPNDKNLFPDGKKASKGVFQALNQRLEALQELLYAEQKHKVLVVLQAMDSGGKDGTIRHVFEHVNPQGVRVASFKVPTRKELAHDYLWRVHRQTPGRGEIVIFNRSHYEDVLVVRVDKIVPREVWQRRYAHINDFERMLADEGTTILKFYLHIDLDEQKERFLARINEPNKRWKFSHGDLEKRAQWPQYIDAYQDALSKTSTDWAPWYVVPANRKWYRNLVIATILVETLEGLDMRYPQPEEGLDDVVIV